MAAGKPDVLITLKPIEISAKFQRLYARFELAISTDLMPILFDAGKYPEMEMDFHRPEIAVVGLHTKLCDKSVN
jgi:hypothetical protein